MNLKLITGVRDQKAAGSNPATSTRTRPGCPDGVSRSCLLFEKWRNSKGAAERSEAKTVRWTVFRTPGWRCRDCGAGRIPPLRHEQDRDAPTGCPGLVCYLRSGGIRRVRPSEVRQKQSGGLFLEPRAGGAATAAPGESRHFDTIEALQSLRLRAFLFFQVHTKVHVWV